ncbi:ribosome recycling factor, partial [Porphyromonas sp.]
MSTSQFTKPAEQSMLKAVEFLQDKLDHIRAGKANPSLLDDIMVEAYGAPMPLNQVATVTV